MTRIITYDLRLGAPDSDEYYRTIVSFADAWLGQTIHEVGDILTSFRQHRQSRGQVDRSDGEYAIELLALGVLLREHGSEASGLPAWSVYILNKLLAAQTRWPRLENRIKNLRGWVGWMSSHTKSARTDKDAFTHLLVWLHANGEDGRAKRLTEWHNFLESSGSYTEQNLVSICLRLADFFAASSSVALGKYTEGVEHFLSETMPHYRRRYDAGLISRTPLEYHLGMLGTELLNRAYRQRFLSTPRKVVILPPCMKAQSDTACKALATPFGAKCQNCTPTCRVHQITRLGEKRGFDVYMIPEELRVFTGGGGKSGFGVVGVSCALTNWSGGWDTDAMGIPAQGVLLDYVGCKYHWDEIGIPTDTNIIKIQEVVG
jgi:uncharacterized protein